MSRRWLLIPGVVCLLVAAQFTTPAVGMLCAAGGILLWEGFE